ncbi:MAG: hypothetical protein P8X80_05815 [Desulfobacterales bacterium]
MAPRLKFKHQPDSTGRFNSFSGKFGVAYGAKPIPARVYGRVGLKAGLPTPLMFPFTNLCYPKFP